MERLSVDQYHAMVRYSILNEGDPIELLDGILVAKLPRSTAHSVAVNLLRAELGKVVPTGWFVDTSGATTLATSEPEPDGMVIRGDVRNYIDHHPGPLELALIVEVADVSLSNDRDRKKAIYAAAGISVYWIVNLIDRRVEAYTVPVGADYSRRQEFGEADAVPLAIEGREIDPIAVRELLP